MKAGNFLTRWLSTF